MRDQRCGLFEALGANAHVVALNVVDAGQSLSYISVEVNGIPADGYGEQIVSTAEGDGGGHLLMVAICAATAARCWGGIVSHSMALTLKPSRSWQIDVERQRAGRLSSAAMRRLTRAGDHPVCSAAVDSVAASMSCCIKAACPAPRV